MADEVKPKAATIRPLDPTSKESEWIKAEVEAQVAQSHQHLRSAMISVVMKLNWSGDAEGKSPIGQAKLVSELTHRLWPEGEGEAPDFVLLLNGTLWEQLDDKQQRYILDELLCYCGVVEDKNGDQAVDETGRQLWRLNKPELTGFAGPIARHGAQLRGIKAFFKTAGSINQKRLFEDDPKAARKGKAGASEEEAQPHN